MKKFKRILAIVMTLAMVLTMGIGLSASAAGTGSITINAPDNITLTSQTFSAYQIFTVEISTDSVTGAIDGYVYTLNSAYSGFLALHPTYGADEAAFIEWFEDKSDNADDLNQLAIDLMTFITDTPAITATGSATGASTPGVKSVTISAVPYGYYLVTGNGNEAASIHTLVTVPGKDTAGEPDDNVEIYVKADAPTIDKEVWFHEDGTSPIAGDAGWKDWTDVNIGDTVYFKHESKVPAMLGYDRYWFIVHDSMSKGLTLNHTDATTSTFAVSVGGAPLTQVADAAAFTSAPGAAQFYVEVGSNYNGGYTAYTDGTNFIVVINPDWFVKQAKDAAILITYEATLNEDAVIGAPGNPNKVYLQYSSNPYDTGDGTYGNPGDTEDTPEDEVFVYTFDLDIYKYTGTLSSSSEKALPGAEFELRTVENDDRTAIKFVDLTGGNYRVATDDDATTTTALVSPTSGEIHIDGLDAGTYYLVETEAPTGYNELDDAIIVVIAHDDGEGAYTVSWEIGTVNDTGTVNVENNTGAVFPRTGGIGRTIFIVVGLTLMAGAVVVLTVRRKVSKTAR